MWIKGSDLPCKVLKQHLFCCFLAFLGNALGEQWQQLHSEQEAPQELRPVVVEGQGFTLTSGAGE